MSVFPSKVNFVTGDILTATDVNEIGQAINLLDGAQTSGAKNRVLNSNFSVWQRGTSSAVTSSSLSFLLADRWKVYRAATGSTVSRQVTGDTTNLPFIQYCQRIARDSGNAATNPIITWQNFETVNSIPLAGKTVTLSFYARAGANYSATSNGLSVQLIVGTGTDQDAATGYTGAGGAIVQTATLTTTWQRFSYSATIAATVTEMAPYFTFTPTGTAGANDYYEITGVQLEAANTASPYAPNGATYQAELAACQRYYFRTAATSAYSVLGGTGYATSTTNFSGSTQAPVTMRVVPTSVDFSTIAYQDAAGGVISISASTLDANQSSTQFITTNNTVTGATAQRFGRLIAANNSAAFLGFSAEL